MIHFILGKWAKNGFRPVYRAHHVNAAAAMLREYCSLPHTITCVTDAPERIDSSIRIVQWPEEPPGFEPHSRPNCYRRIWYLSREFQAHVPGTAKDMFVSIDLDMVILRDITALLQQMLEHPICFLRGRFTPLQGSLWSFKRGAGYYAWKEYNPHTTPLLVQQLRTQNSGWVGSDQAYFSHQFHGEEARIQAHLITWRNGVHQFIDPASTSNRRWTSGRILFFAGQTKPWHPRARDSVPAAHAQYMRFLGDTT